MTIKEYRILHGLTQAKLADAIGCVPAAVSFFETGNRIPSKGIMRQIMRVTSGKVMPNDFYEVPSLGR